MRRMVFISPIAGVAQLLRGKFLMGLVLLVIWMVALNGAAVLGPGLMPRSLSILVTAVSWCIFAAVAGVSIIDVLRHTHPQRREEFEKKKGRLLMDGITAYLQDDLDSAVRHLSEMVKLDIDDADARIYLAMAYKAYGDVAAARKHFKRCRALNKKKWCWEVDEGLKSQAAGK